jgi:hypothetical protein
MADDAAPWRGARPKTDAKPKGTRPGAPPKKRDLTPVSQLRDNLKGVVTGIGMGVYRYNPVDGVIVIGAAPELVDAYCDLAEHNIYVHRVLNAIGGIGDGLGILLPTLNVAAAIAQNHGLYDGPLMVSVREYERRALAQNPDLGEDDAYDETEDSDLDDVSPIAA